MRNLKIVCLGAVLAAACVTNQEVTQRQGEVGAVVDENVTLRLRIKVGVPAERYDDIVVSLDGGRAIALIEEAVADRPAPDSPEAAYEEAQRVPVRRGTAEVITHAPRALLSLDAHPLRVVEAASGETLAESPVIWHCPEKRSALREIEKYFGVVYGDSLVPGPWALSPHSAACRYADPTEDQEEDF